MGLGQDDLSLEVDPEQENDSVYYRHYPMENALCFSLTTFYRMMFRKLLPMFKAQGRLLYGETTSRVLYRITPHLAMKINGYGLFTEANTLGFVRDSTSIPVPRVLDAWMEAEHSITLLEWIPDCETLRDCWSRLSQDQKDSIADQVKGYVDQLRSIRRPPKYQTRIEPVDGSSFFHDCVLGKPRKPFSSEKEFNELLISRVERYAALAESAKAQKEWIRNNLRDDHKITFTHGDLNPTNILIDRTGKVVAIIDWTMSGWMPEYWEYTCCTMGADGAEGWAEYSKSLTYVDNIQLKVQETFIEMHGYGHWYI